jgi:hypothetical protein
MTARFYEGLMSKTKTTRYDVAEHLCSPWEMAAYFEAGPEEADGDAAFIAKVLDDNASVIKYGKEPENTKGSDPFRSRRPTAVGPRHSSNCREIHVLICNKKSI